MNFEELLKESYRTVPHLDRPAAIEWAKKCAAEHPGFITGHKQEVMRTDRPSLSEAASVNGAAAYKLSAAASSIDRWAVWIWRILILLMLLALCASGLRAQSNYTPTDPCQRSQKHFTNINQTANTQLIPGVASQNIYICGIWIAPVGTATNIAFVEGTGSTCGTGTAGLPTMGGGGSGTAATGPNLAVNEGYVAGNGGWSIGMTATIADSVCLFQSAANQISGVIIWVQRP